MEEIKPSLAYEGRHLYWEAPTKSDEAYSDEEQDFICEKVAELSPQERTLVYLLFWGNLPEKEVALFMGLTAERMEKLKSKTFGLLQKLHEKRFFKRKSCSSEQNKRRQSLKR